MSGYPLIYLIAGAFIAGADSRFDGAIHMHNAGTEWYIVV
jgi:hypothetical protein